MPGGKRTGTGRPTAFSEAEKRAVLEKAARVFSVDAPQDMPELYRALKDLAMGTKVLAKVEWKGRRRLLIEGEEEFEDSFGQPCWLYTTKPDLAAVKFLMEKTTGKAATASTAQVETEIRLVLPVGVRKAGR